MNKHIDDFNRVIPRDIYLKTQGYVSDQIAIVLPDVFVPRVEVIPKDYHFIIFQSTPPLGKIGKSELQFRKGTLVILEPGTEFKTLSTDFLPGKYISITIKKDFFERVSLEATGKDKVKFKEIENGFSWNLLNSIEKFKYELSNYGNSYPAMIQSISVQIVNELLRDTNINSITKSIIESSDIKKVVEYMHGYYNSNITMEEISQVFHISNSHLQRKFKMQMGQTPHQYLLGIRLQKSKELLLRGQHSMAEVARLSGFVSQSHFSTVFKNITGISPTEYRKTKKTL